MIMNIVIASINASYIPWLYQACFEKKYKEIKKVGNILTIIMAIMVLIPIVWGPEIIAFLGSTEYAIGKWLIPPISLSVFFTFLYSVLFGNVEFYYEKNVYVTIASIIGAITNIVLNYIFIPLLGYQAAAYTTLICYILFSLCHFAFTVKICKANCIEYIYDKKFIFTCSVGIIIISSMFLIIYTNDIIRYFILISLLLIGIVFHKNIRNKLILLAKIFKT